MIAILFGSALATACATTDKPAVAACSKSNSAGGATWGGELAVLPSRLPGLTITKASWRTHASHANAVTTEYLVFSSTLHAERAIRQNEVAILFDAPGPHAIVDNGLADEGATQLQLSADAPFLDSGAERTTMRMVQLGADYRLSSSSTLGYCPSTVRIVPRNSIAMELKPDLATPRGQAMLARLAHAGASPLVVVADTVVSDGPGSSLLVGAAMNTSDSTLTDMVAGIVLRAGGTAADTLEYLLGPIAPHAVIGFAGGAPRSDERVVERVTYRSTDVRDRSIAGEDQLHRASEATHDSRVRAQRRAMCAASPTSCAR